MQKDKKPSQSPSDPHWKQVGFRHHHGINIPLFSIHSSRSCGIGEYEDLLPLIKWCAEQGFDVIQLLPLNDTGQDKSPYCALSAFALNPLFLSLSSLPEVDKHPELLQRIEDLRVLNTTLHVDYDRVRTKKEAFLQLYWKLEYASISKKPEYTAYLQNNSWLQGYALFKALKTEFKDAYWIEWPPEIRSPDQKTLESLLNSHQEAVSYHCFIQYLCHQQLKEVKNAASASRVSLMGDIPILISPDSADVWLNPQFFNLQLHAGAPPDMYNEEGQNWGFPIYDWVEMQQDDYSWWRARLNYASHYYHIYRIDHIVGFFRIWAVPEGEKALQGAFIPIDKERWIPHGTDVMHMMLESSSMLPIGEDLGTVPPEVRLCLKELGICGTKVLRWERYWKEDLSYIPIDAYLPMSLTTVSTHDSTTLSEWWKENAEEALEFCKEKNWTYAPKITREQLLEILTDSHKSSSLFHINLLNEYLALFPEMVHSDPSLERINLPGIIQETNWSYRMIPSIEEITSHKGLQELFRKLALTHDS